MFSIMAVNKRAVAGPTDCAQFTRRESDQARCCRRPRGRCSGFVVPDSSECCAHAKPQVSDPGGLEHELPNCCPNPHSARRSGVTDVSDVIYRARTANNLQSSPDPKVRRYSLLPHPDYASRVSILVRPKDRTLHSALNFKLILHCSRECAKVAKCVGRSYIGSFPVSNLAEKTSRFSQREPQYLVRH